ncbi:MAG TPA: cellulose biosynthesis protein BcsN [Methylocystis sp.]|nr:cellulose biosynthesis protein BcsN [Methylocystis sp.]
MRRRSPLLLLLLLSLAACSRNESDRNYLASAAPLGESIGGKARRGDEPVIKTVLAPPPSTGPLGPVAEKIYADGWRQSQSLDRRQHAGGWNDLAIDIRFEGARRRGAKIPMGPPTKEGIAKEIAARFKGLEMRVVKRQLANALGPYGLAIGASGDLRCVFAWQWLDDLPGGDWAGKKSASIRLRLCRPKVTADELAAIFEGLQLGDPSALETIAATWKDAPDSAFVDAAPQAQAIVDTSLEAALAATKTAASRDAGNGRPPHRLRPRTHAGRAIVVPPQAAPTERRFLAPSEASRSPSEQKDASVSPVPAQSRLDASLPPQAYRGPAPAQSAKPSY